MRTHLLRSLIVASVIAAPAAAFAQDCPTVIYFGNGISTTQDGAQLSRDLLRDAVNVEARRTGRQALPAACFASAYATPEGRLGDLLESWGQLEADRETHLWRLLAGFDELSDAEQQLFDEAYREAARSEFISSSDLQRQVLHYRATTATRKAIVVAHSQGNLFANQAFSTMDSGADGGPLLTAGRFSIVSVATPQSFVATGGLHITLYGDAILAVSSASWANTETDETPCRPIFGNQRPGLRAVACHLFDTSYMVGTYSQRQIVSQVVAGLTRPEDPAAPIARFTFRRGDLSATENEELRVIVSVGEEALIAFQDESVPRADPIVYREWRVHTQTGPIAVGDTAFTRGFTTTGPPARYEVTLLVRDAANRVSEASASLVVESPYLFVDPQQDPPHSPYFTERRFSDPQIATDGSLRVASYGAGFNFRLHGLSRDGRVLWSNPDFSLQAQSLDQLASRILRVGSAGQTFFSGARDRIFSATADGQAVSGWPVSLDPPELPPGTGGWWASLIGVDPQSSIAVAAGSVTLSFIARQPLSIYAFLPNGSAAWPRRDFDDGFEPVLSEGRIHVNLRDRAAWYDVTTGAETCSTSRPAPLSYHTIAGPGGVFGSYREHVTRIEFDCTVSTIFSSTVSDEVTLLAAGSDIVMGREYLRPSNGSVDPATYRLIGISPDGGRVWRQSEIVPEGDAVRAIRDGVVYAVGTQRGDAAQTLHLFYLAAVDGAILQRVALTQLCDSVANCGVVLSAGGAVYVNDRASTRIFRLPPAVSAGG